MKNDAALLPANLYVRPKDERFQDHYRRWQGIPSIEATKKGRVFVAFYTGQGAEVGGNIGLVCISDDKGETFRSCETVIEHPDPECRIFDPSLWIDPKGRLFLFWNQSRHFNDGRIGVFTSVLDDPDGELTWSAPRRIANGIMMNKPTVTRDGEWLFPCAIWCNTSGSVPAEDHGLQNEQFSNVYVSTDEGKTFSLRGHADVPNRGFDEHMIVEKEDGTLWMLVRTFDGIGESFSTDGGRTWSPGVSKSHIDGPCSRFFIRRLVSGRLLLVNHDGFTERLTAEQILSQGDVKKWKGRSHLHALLSEDDGKTWPYKLLLDIREHAAYPDAATDGEFIYVTYDYERVRAREIFMARITEEDILKGELTHPESRLKILVNKATGMPDIE
ncbi:glycoside hydrolase [Oscillospiraceae bacterium OttesenSCG-928-G22]|nr:glycoside hydrolase [Oscillospiraceae bacterium OttesenSCG-928-G22]